jgi:hypothetical protein
VSAASCRTTAAYLNATLTLRDEIVGRYIFDAFPDNPDDPSTRLGASAPWAERSARTVRPAPGARQ